jgi:hypothetical protein
MRSTELLAGQVFRRRCIDGMQSANDTRAPGGRRTQGSRASRPGDLSCRYSSDTEGFAPAIRLAGVRRRKYETGSNRWDRQRQDIVGGTVRLTTWKRRSLHTCPREQRPVTSGYGTGAVDARGGARTDRRRRQRAPHRGQLAARLACERHRRFVDRRRHWPRTAGVAEGRPAEAPHGGDLAVD